MVRYPDIGGLVDSLNRDGQQGHHYQDNEPSPLT
jgi:hypothetical protein